MDFSSKIPTNCKIFFSDNSFGIFVKPFPKNKSMNYYHSVLLLIGNIYTYIKIQKNIPKLYLLMLYDWQKSRRKAP